MKDYLTAGGHMRTSSLFLETIQPHVKQEPVYTLKHYDHNGLPSAYRIYMEANTEYDAAMKLVGDMRHWRKLCDTEWFMNGWPEKMFEGLAQWRKDKEEQEMDYVIKLLKEQAEDGNVTAQRTLIDHYKPNKASKVRAKVQKQQEEFEEAVKDKDAKILDLHKKILKNRQNG